MTPSLTQPQSIRAAGNGGFRLVADDIHRVSDQVSPTTTCGAAPGTAYQPAKPSPTSSPVSCSHRSASSSEFRVPMDR